MEAMIGSPEVTQTRKPTIRQINEAASGSSEPAMIAGMRMSARQLRSFLETKKSKRDRGVDESDNPIAHIKILSLESMTSDDLRVLADLIDTGNVTVETQGIGSNPAGKMDTTSGSGTKPGKGTGDVGSNPTSAPKGTSAGAQNPSGSVKSIKQPPTTHDGTGGTHPPGKAKENNNSGQTKAKKGTGDIGSNPSVESVAGVLSRNPRKVAPLENVERGYPNAERQGPGSGPNVDGGKKYASPKLPSKAGGEVSGTGPKVGGGKANSLNAPIPPRFGNDATGTANAMDSEESGPTTLEGMLKFEEFQLEQLGTGLMGNIQTPGKDASQSMSGNKLDGHSILQGSKQGMGDLKDTSAQVAEAGGRVNRLWTVYTATNSASAATAMKLIKAVVPNVKNIGDLSAADAEAAMQAVEIRQDMLDFNDKERRGLNTAERILRIQKLNQNGISSHRAFAY